MIAPCQANTGMADTMTPQPKVLEKDRVAMPSMTALTQNTRAKPVNPPDTERRIASGAAQNRAVATRKPSLNSGLPEAAAAILRVANWPTALESFCRRMSLPASLPRVMASSTMASSFNLCAALPFKLDTVKVSPNQTVKTPRRTLALDWLAAETGLLRTRANTPPRTIPAELMRAPTIGRIMGLGAPSAKRKVAPAVMRLRRVGRRGPDR